MLLEICASNFQSAVNAEKAGANRLELCSELAVGGITPSYGFIKKVIETVSIPVFVLIRPRSGDFTYSDEEFQIMMDDITMCKNLKCAGIVSGILTIDNSIDILRTKKLIAHSKPLPFTFHRAFDWTPNPYEAMEQLIDLNVDRILTSGQETSAENGIIVLQQLKKLANGRVGILPAGGINPDNAALFKDGNFDEIHASATLATSTKSTVKVPMNSLNFLDETKSYNSNIERIQSILKQINDKA